MASTDSQVSKGYLLKLLLLLIKRDAKGEVRVSAQELMDDDLGQGFLVYFDHAAKELVIQTVPKGATVYKVEENLSWTNSIIQPQTPPPQPQRPLTREEQLVKAWVDGQMPPAYPTQSPENKPEEKNKVVTLDEQRQAEIESRRRVQQILKEIENYGSPQPRSRQAQTVSSPQSKRPDLTPTYFKS